jgi:phosphonate transport system ATP-binding protein
LNASLQAGNPRRGAPGAGAALAFGREFVEAEGMENPALEAETVSKTFGERKALDGVSLRLRAGEMTALIGPSGSGKSTLMRVCAGLLEADPEAGAVRIEGALVQERGALARDVRAARRKVGFIFQQFNLVGRLSALGNVLIGGLARVSGWKAALGLWTPREKHDAMAALDRAGVMEFAGRRTSTLSGGQQQRVAIARALHQGANLLFADEPIASLDPVSARRAMALLQELNERDGKTILVTLHQVDYALKYCRRIVALKEGRVAYDGPAGEIDKGKLADIYGAEIEEAFWTEPVN